jgi:DNA-binding CsgD family transcriptional regulator
MTEKAAAIVQNRLKVYDPESSEKSELDSGILSTLSSTELQILEHVANHKSMKDIATELEISPNTVNNHQSNIRRKLSLSGRSSLLQFALGLKKYLSKKKFK